MNHLHRHFLTLSTLVIILMILPVTVTLGHDLERGLERENQPVSELVCETTVQDWDYSESPSDSKSVTDILVHNRGGHHSNQPKTLSDDELKLLEDYKNKKQARKAGVLSEWNEAQQKNIHNEKVSERIRNKQKRGSC